MLENTHDLSVCAYVCVIFIVDGGDYSIFSLFVNVFDRSLYLLMKNSFDIT